jgi:hypothetical protein
MTDPEVPGWQHIGPPESPEQEHVCRPRAHPADRDPLIVRLVIGNVVEPIEPIEPEATGE